MLIVRNAIMVGFKLCVEQIFNMFVANCIVYDYTVQGLFCFVRIRQGIFYIHKERVRMQFYPKGQTVMRELQIIAKLGQIM